MIGGLASRTGTKINTIRFYEEIGLLPPPLRTGSGRRIYDGDDIHRLSFIRNARGLGFSINEIRSLIALSGEKDQKCVEARDLAARHLSEVEARLVRLEQLRDELKRVAACKGERASECSVIQAITGKIARS